jgi:hemoglobin
MQNNKHDIESEQDIQLMVNSFYAKVNEDPLLAYVFNDFARVDWEAHLPKMYAFWNSLILGTQEYKGSPFAAHISLPIESSHFERWIALFEKNIDELFFGQTAEQTKQRAKSIAYVFQSKLNFIQSSSNRNEK